MLDCWEDCTILVDSRERDGISVRYGRLREALDSSADPVLTLFMRFFPLATYMSHLGDVAQHWGEAGSSRHFIPWNKGLMLRFFGLLVRMAMAPLPNVEFHWRWPLEWPNNAHVAFTKWMSEAEFKRYWQYIPIPGYMGGEPEAINEDDTRSPLY